MGRKLGKICNPVVPSCVRPRPSDPWPVQLWNHALGSQPDRRSLSVYNPLVSMHRARPTVRSLKVLIVDEISMLDAAMFDSLEHVARALRRNDSPFGGIRLVLSGDFFQASVVTSFLR